jgi:hypothetical protein
MDYVYGKRNLLLIKCRKIESYIYKIISKWIKYIKIKSSTTEKSVICCYPAFNNVDEANEIMNRFAWAFPEQSGIKIYFTIHNNIDTKSCEKELDNQCSFLKNNKNVIKVSKSFLKKTIRTSSTIAIHDRKSRYNLRIMPYLDKCKIIDPNYYSLEEGNFWKFGCYDHLSAKERKYYQDISLTNFKSFKLMNSSKNKANIFVTGPSFQNYNKYNYDTNSIKIVCNTIVKDKEFLEYIGGPDIITFADPVFHFSSNKYACEFRRLVLEAVIKYGSYVAVPQATVPTLLGNFPELKNKIIGLRFSSYPVFPSENFLAVKPSGSIITFIMIPLASCMADEIYILGADGRGKKENYFWKHSEKVQLNDLMETVFKTHPSFFRDRDYVDHYDEHCEYIEKLFRIGESEYKRKYYSLTDSNIAAIQNRKYVD